MKRIRILAAAGLTALALASAGCSGGGTGDDTAASGEPGAVEATSAATSAPSGPAPAGDANGITALALCDYLTDELPGLQAVGDEVGVMAQLAMGLAGWYDARGGQVPDGGQIEEFTSRECPQIRAEVLKLAGVTSFRQL